MSGGSEGADNGTLAVMVGGPGDALEQVRPFLEAYSKSIVHVGEEPGSGQMVKLMNQVLVVLNQLAVSEALLLGAGGGYRSGDDPGRGRGRGGRLVDALQPWPADDCP